MIRELLTNQNYSENIAVIENGSEITYAELLGKALGIARLMYIGQQDCAAILLPDGSKFITALWGTFMAGFSAFPLNTLMTKYEILSLIQTAQVKTVITSKTYGYIFASLSLKIIYIEEIRPQISDFSVPDIDSEKTILLLNTSGTTDKPKIVQLSEKNIITSVFGYLDKLRFDTTNIRYTLALPFSSAYGIMVICVCLIKAFPIVIIDDFFTLESFYSAAEKYRITHYEGSATILLLMMQMAGREIPYDIGMLKYFGFGGSKVSEKTVAGLISAYPDMEFYQGYGMTEAAPLITKHPQGKLEKTGSVGTAVKGLEIAIETKTGITSVPNVTGEILVAGDNVMQGYLNNKTDTDRVLKNGYLYTGDIGFLDENGYLYICGRKKKIIIVRGFKVHPEEVEECIINNPLVSDCYVYGQIDEYGNESVCADIVPSAPQICAKKITEYCKKHLADYKIPFKIYFRERIERNAAGKIKRR